MTDRYAEPRQPTVDLRETLLSTNGVSQKITKIRRPVLETAQRWLRKEVRPPRLHRLATSNTKAVKESPPGPSHSSSSSSAERQVRSTVSSTEMFR